MGKLRYNKILKSKLWFFFLVFFLDRFWLFFGIIVLIIGMIIKVKIGVKKD